MPFFRKKPVVIEARRVPSIDDFDSIKGYLNVCIGLADWCGGMSYMLHDGIEDAYGENDPGYDHILIPTLEGDMRARVGSYIIKGVEGEFYPIDPEILEKTYEAVEA